MITGIGTNIKVKDFQKSYDFYTALGFEKVMEFGPGLPLKKGAKGNIVTAPERYRGVIFEHGGCKFEIIEGHPAVKHQVFQKHIPSSKVSLMVYVNSISDLLECCEKANIPLRVGPRHYYYGTLEIVVQDPDGFIVVFIAPYTEEEAKKVKADEYHSKPQPLL